MIAAHVRRKEAPRSPGCPWSPLALLPVQYLKPVPSLHATLAPETWALVIDRRFVAMLGKTGSVPLLWDFGGEKCKRTLPNHLVAESG